MLYRERLTVPLLWWLLAVGFAVSMLAAFGFYLGLWWGVGTALASLAVAVALFQSSAVLIIVEPNQLRVGRAIIEHDYLASCRALDADQTSRRSGTEADARAQLVLRPYVRTAVELTLDDPADPVPYWLVSTRRPHRLAEAVERARTADHLSSPGE